MMTDWSQKSMNALARNGQAGRTRKPTAGRRLSNSPAPNYKRTSPLIPRSSWSRRYRRSPTAAAICQVRRTSLTTK